MYETVERKTEGCYSQWLVRDDSLNLAATCPTEADARRIAAALNLVEGGAVEKAQRALRACEAALSDIVNAADNGESYSAEELADFANHACGKAREALAALGGEVGQ